MYTTVKSGSKYTESFKVYIKKNNEIISPFHDISPNIKENSNIITVFNEIPRFENAKFEMSKKEKMNPIMQDVKKGKPRFVSNIFPYKGYIWNYGAIPQTWENPKEKDIHTQAIGDNDPIDVIEIGSKKKHIGQVYEAKVLGCLAMLDDGECDWKVLVIDINDVMCTKLNDIDDVKKNCPGLLENTIDWFRNYKKPDGKDENKFALDSKFSNSEFAMEIIREAHKQWRIMFYSENDHGISKVNRSNESSKEMAYDFSIDVVNENDSTPPESTEGFYYILK